VLGATRGRPGGVYFVTDGDPVVFREFVTQLLATQGIEAPARNMPAPVAAAAASTLEGVWKLLRRPSPPPVTRLAYWLSAQECTIDISRARAELGYEPVRTIADGMAELST
jgi:nucleoside-diphosphate-sugar epimerase